MRPTRIRCICCASSRAICCKAGVLILATYRETEVRLSAEHTKLLSSIGREGRTIHLGGLSEEEVAAFAKNNAALGPMIA